MLTTQEKKIECIHELFEKQAVRSPDAVALVCDDVSLTYRELNQRADALACHLRDQGVEQETLVGICTARSVDMVVAMFAVFKAGGAYVPLDPSYPKERLGFILTDTQMPLMITQNSYLALFAEQPVRTVCMEGDWQKSVEFATPPDVSPESLAYVIYTSGSTGNPKGVMITHSNLSHFVRLAGSALDASPDDVYLQTASMSYALSVRQLMIPLANGATVVLANAEEMRDPLLMFQLIKHAKITLIDFVPSFWRACLQRLSDLSTNERKELLDNSLRRIVSIGEPLMHDLPHDWFYKLGHTAQLVNIFGQTETTGVVATYPIPRETPARLGIVPIGRSIPDTQLYILDADLKPVPVGEPGELCISNPCLARGYLNRPELTAEKFVPNPFEDGSSPCLYRTGDMAQQSADGNIEFLGRRDFQVKIRGQRIELGEIEAAIRRHPMVRECAVMARGDQPDEKYLAAYVVRGDQSLGEAELRDFVRTILPDVMIPSVFMFLAAMPLTANGKLNRLALPDPVTAKPVDQDFKTQAEPRNHIERTILGIWKDLLKRDRLSIHDNFFDLGGHSLMSVRMFARIERDLGVRLPYTSLFHATTIAQIAELVANANEDVTKWKIVVPVHIRGSKTPFFGVHAHEGGVLFWRDIVSHLPDDQPFYALQAIGVDGIQVPLNRIPDMARLYIQELRKVQPHGPYYMGGYSMGGEIAFEMAQQLVRQGEKVDLLVMFDTRNPNRSLRTVARDAEGALRPQIETKSTSSGRTLFNKLIGHFLRLSRLGFGQQFLYLLNQVLVRTVRFTVFALATIYRKLKRRLPDGILLPYLRFQHSAALTNYVPAVYPGKVTLFRATQTLIRNPDDSPMGWKPLAGGGLDVYHFDAPHEIVSARYAPEVAAQLQECLKQSRGE